MKKYSVRESIPEDAKQGLAELPELTAHLLFHRGVKNRDDAQNFLNPDYALHAHDPFLLEDMEKAVARILLAIEKNEKICIYSDYDADGVPAAVVLHDFLTKIEYKNFEIYIPHRHNEGFGLNCEAIKTIAKNSSTLLITLDCGITDVAEVEQANELGIDVIITDHHLPADVLPPAFAIINPKRLENKYPFDMLCGSGVAFKLVQAILQRNSFGLKEGWEKWLLDMVGLATCADMVPLTGENRVFAYYGLKVLRKSPRAGLLSLFQKLKVNQKHLTEDDIGFTIGPRINAASRMGVPMEAFRLLSTVDDVEADQVSSYLNRINDERKGIVGSMVKEMKKKLEVRASENPVGKVIVMGNPEWRPALLGLAANSLMADHACPVFLWGRDGETALKGSCRSNGGVSVLELMRETSPGVLLDYGGHKLAGGFTVSSEKIHFLESELLNAYEKLESSEAKPEEIFLDAKLSLDSVNWQTWNTLEKLAPFGIGNPKPLFLFENSEIQNVKKFGKEENHLQIDFVKNDGRKVSAIGFFMNGADFGAVLQKGLRINLVATMEKSMFRSFPELRLRIVDII